MCLFCYKLKTGLNMNAKHLKVGLLFPTVLLGSALNAQAQDQEKPNILWLTCEDMSFDYLSCNGNNTIETPNLDAFAENGIRFTNAYSNAPQCSPARTTLISGMYATSLGGEWHRQRRRLPRDIYFPDYLRDNGYYCINKGKEDYNANNYETSDMWDPGSHYNDAPSDQPWFVVMNYYNTHMSRVTNYPLDERANRTVGKQDVRVPGYLPDNDTIRDDLAWHYEFVKKLDDWFGNVMGDLENKGLDENTIVFFFSDHGGSLPGSKAYLRQAGTKVPMLAWFPPKWEHLAPKEQPAVYEKPVGFVDMGPTALSLAGVEPPERMQGKPFCGEYEQEPKDFAFLYKANQALNYIPARGITDGDFKLIRNYNTAFPKGTRQRFQWKMPGLRAWEQEFRAGHLLGVREDFWQPAPPIELYDLQNDPGETNNLANDPNYSDELEFYTNKLKERLVETKDLGFFPHSMRDFSDTASILYHDVRQTDYNLEEVYEAAAFASTAQPGDLDSLMALLNHPRPVIRYWGSLGIFQLSRRDEVSNLPQRLEKVILNEQENIEVRLNCAAAWLYDGHYCHSLDLIYDEWTRKTPYGRAYMHNIQDHAKALSRDIYEFTLENSGFYNRSAAINTGVVPYDKLIHGDLTTGIDTFYFQWEILRDKCEELDVTCSQSFYHEDFNVRHVPSDWQEQNTSGQMSIINDRLALTYSSGNPKAVKTFDPRSGLIHFGFTYNSERNFHRCYVNFLDQDDEVCGQLIMGNNSDKGMILMHQYDQGGNPVDYTDVLNGNFAKNVDYRVSTNINTKEDLITLRVNGSSTEGAINAPLFHEIERLSGVEFWFYYMYNSDGNIFIDDFEIAEGMDKSPLIKAIYRAQTVLDTATVDTVPGTYKLESWRTLQDSLYNAYDYYYSCGYNEAEIHDEAQALSDATDHFLTDTIEVSTATNRSIQPSLQANDVCFPGLYNPDQMGDFDMFSHAGIRDYELMVYDMQGRLVFRGGMHRKWQGRNNGSRASRGIYIWKARVQTREGSHLIHSGKTILMY